MTADRFGLQMEAELRLPVDQNPGCWAAPDRITSYSLIRMALSKKHCWRTQMPIQRNPGCRMDRTCSILFRTLEGASVRKIDIQSGKVIPLFMVNYHHTSVAVSPDGKWLVASVLDEAFSPDIPVLALTRVDTCEIIPLTSLKGYVT